MGFRQALVQTQGTMCITDGGMETVLLFHRGIDLPCFAAFPLLDSDAGTNELRSYYEPYAAIARERGVGLILDTPTWRASADWGDRLGYDAERLAEKNRKAVRLIEQVRADHAPTTVVVCGTVGPRDDAYRPAALMTADEAERYHSTQIETLADAGADMIAGLTLTYPEEAIGIARAAGRAGIPVAVSFTVETDGRLPGSHAELDEAEELDEGDPAELAAQYRTLRALLPTATVVGGCCGTDHRHVAALVDAWLDAA